MYTSIKESVAAQVPVCAMRALNSSETVYVDVARARAWGVKELHEHKIDGVRTSTEASSDLAVDGRVFGLFRVCGRTESKGVYSAESKST